MTEKLPPGDGSVHSDTLLDVFAQTDAPWVDEFRQALGLSAATTAQPLTAAAREGMNRALVVAGESVGTSPLRFATALDGVLGFAQGMGLSVASLRELLRG